MTTFPILARAGARTTIRMVVLAGCSVLAGCATESAILGSGTTTVGDTPAILPEISGRGWITGIHQHMLDPSDPWPEGYRLTDSWGAR